MFTGWMYDMIVGYVGLGMRIEMRLCTIMRVIIISFYEYKPSHFARFATFSCHPNHPRTVLPSFSLLPCGKDSPQSPDFCRISDLVVSSPHRKGNTQRQNWPVTYIGVYYSTDPARIGVQFLLYHTQSTRTGSNFPRRSRIY